MTYDGADGVSDALSANMSLNNAGTRIFPLCFWWQGSLFLREQCFYYQQAEYLALHHDSEIEGLNRHGEMRMEEIERHSLNAVSSAGTSRSSMTAGKCQDLGPYCGSRVVEKSDVEDCVAEM
jgi:hypothetical protein